MQHIALLVLVLVVVTPSAVTQAATVTTLTVGFESPDFAIGAIGGNPPYSAGQGGWGGYSAGAISDAQAHGGTQSLRSGGSLTLGATHSLDPANQGDYPSASVTFPTGYASDWWVQAWVRVDSGGAGARLAMPSWGWYLQISGAGTPSLESAIPGQPPASLPSLGSSVLDRWVLVQMAHDSTADDCGQGIAGRCIDFSIRGDDVDFAFSRYYTASGPLSQYLMLTGDAFWDDVAAGSGAPPALVPLPGAAWLFASALALLGRQRRRVA